MKTKQFNKFLRFVLPKEVIAISLYPFGVYIREDIINNGFTRNHELIHWEQQREMSALGSILTVLLLGLALTFNWPSWVFILTLLLPWTLFYFWYGGEFLILLIKYGRWAYNHISLEQEAYAEQHLDYYLENRKPFIWVKYLF